MNLADLIHNLEKQTSLAVIAQQKQKNVEQEFMALCLMAYDFKNFIESEQLNFDIYTQVLNQIAAKLLEYITNYNMNLIFQFLQSVQRLDDENLLKISQYITIALLQKAQKMQNEQQQQQENENSANKEQKQTQNINSNLLLLQSSEINRKKKLLNQLQQLQNYTNTQKLARNQDNMLPITNEERYQITFSINLHYSPQPAFSNSQMNISQTNTSKIKQSKINNSMLNSSIITSPLNNKVIDNLESSQITQNINTTMNKSVQSQNKVQFTIFNKFVFQKQYSYEQNIQLNNNIQIDISEQLQLSDLENNQTNDMQQLNNNLISYFKQQNKEVKQFIIAKSLINILPVQEEVIKQSQISSNYYKDIVSKQAETFYIFTTDNCLYRGFKDILTKLYEFELLELTNINYSKYDVQSKGFIQLQDAQRRNIYSYHKYYPSMFTPIQQQQNHVIEYSGLTVTDSVFVADQQNNIHELVITGFVCNQQYQLYQQYRNDFQLKYKIQFPKRFTIVNQNLIFLQKEQIEQRIYQKSFGKDDNQYSINKPSDLYYSGKAPQICVQSICVLSNSRYSLMLVAQPNKLVVQNKQYIQLLCGQTIQTSLQPVFQVKQPTKHTPMTTNRDISNSILSQEDEKLVLTSMGLVPGTVNKQIKQQHNYLPKLLQQEEFSDKDGIFDKARFRDIQQVVFGFVSSELQDQQINQQLKQLYLQIHEDTSIQKDNSQHFKIFVFEKLMNQIKEVQIPLNIQTLHQTRVKTLFSGNTVQHNTQILNNQKLQQIENICFNNLLKLLFINHTNEVQYIQNKNFLKVYDYQSQCLFDLIINKQYGFHMKQIQSENTKLYITTINNEVIVIDLFQILNITKSKEIVNISQMNIGFSQVNSSNLHISQISSVNASNLTKQKLGNNQLLNLIIDKDILLNEQEKQRDQQQDSQKENNGAFGLSLVDFEIE